MADKSDNVSSTGDSTVRKERGMNRVLAHVHPRQVIWALLVALIVVLIRDGNGYIARLETVEEHIKVQNGTLKRMQIEQATDRTNIHWLVTSQGGKPVKPPPVEEHE